MEVSATAGTHCRPGAMLWAEDGAEKARNRAALDKARACERLMVFTYKIRNAEEGLKKISLYVDEDAAVWIRFLLLRGTKPSR
jgi:hypothetical protein